MRLFSNACRALERSIRGCHVGTAIGCIGILFALSPGLACGQERLLNDWLIALEEPDTDAAEAEGDTNPAIPDSERPAPRPSELPGLQHPATLGPTSSELQELSQWVRWFTLKNLPPNIEDNRKWGKQKKVVDGVDMQWDGLRFDTKRRWKMADHGTWSRYFIELIDPADRLEIQVLSLDSKDRGKRFTSRIRVVAPLKIFARISQFQRDVQLISVSLQADATVALETDLEVGIRVNPLVFPPDVEFQPKVTRAEVQVLEFELHRISQIHGDLAEWIGKGLRKILDRKLTDTNDKLVVKINDNLAKHQDRFKLSAQEWFASSFHRSSEIQAADIAKKEAEGQGK